MIAQPKNWQINRRHIMQKNSLTEFISAIRSVWQKGSNIEDNACKLMKKLALTSNLESWLVPLHSGQQKSVELYRDIEYGFVLLAHVEHQGLYRPPHNHGNGWVCYAVQHGQMEMSTFDLLNNHPGQNQVVSRGSYEMQAGDCSAFLPGDIHDTLCLSDYVVMLRLTSCDLQEEKRQGRVLQFTK
jgi:hypothetical protein